MNHPAAHASPPSSGPADDFTWLSNPLDWRPIDRFILLGALLLIAPTLFGFTLLAVMVLAPDYLAPVIARLLLAMFALHGLMLAGYIGAAPRCAAAVTTMTGRPSRTSSSFHLSSLFWSAALPPVRT
jgi:hypothetical protein